MSSHPKSERDIYPQVIAAEGTLPLFRPGALVLLSLHSPREKLFGAIVALAPHGLVFCGIPLDSLEDFAAQIREGDAVRPSVLFFPMHRVERIEIDQRSGDVASISERFSTKTGLAAAQVFSRESVG